MMRTAWALLRGVSSIALLVAVLAALAHLPVWLQQARVVALTQYLDEAEGESLRAAVEQLAAHGDAGLAATVAALGTERVELTRAARHALRQQLIGWRRVAPTAAQRRRRQLATILAQQVAHLPPSGQLVAAELATAILVEIRDDSQADAASLACQRVLAQIAGVALGPEPDDPPPTTATFAAAAGMPRLALPTSLLQPDELSDIAGGGLPIDVLLAISPPPLEPAMELQHSPPRAADFVAEGESVAPAGEARIESTAAERAVYLEGVSTDPVASAQASTGASASPDLATMPSAALCELLHDETQAESAQQELVRRGMTARAIEIGRNLTHPNAEHRRTWTGWLPRVIDVDVRPWLIHLSHDSDAEVRQAAASIMATTGDRYLLNRLAEMSRFDPDPRVRETASRRSISSR